MIKEWLFAALLLSLLVTEIALYFALRDTVRELRGMRRDMPKIAGAAVSLFLLGKAVDMATKGKEK